MKKLTTEEFIQRTIIVHKYRYSYLKTNYINNRTKIVITCYDHGDFLQTPNNHLMGNNCPVCGRKKQIEKTKISNEEFIIQLNKILPSITPLEKYKNYNLKILVKDSLNIVYKTTPASLLHGIFPSILSALNPITAFIIKSKNIHNNKYDYSKTQYINSVKKVIIICPVHGEFQQTPVSHLQGHSCFTCTERTGWKRNEWIQYCINQNILLSNLYIIKCFNDKEDFIKIGITTKTITTRFKTPSSMPYKYKILKEIKGSPEFVFDKEKELHKKFKEYKYKPKLSFAGETECFNLDVLAFL